MSYRPLIRLSAGSADTFLPCDTLYSLPEIAKLKKHLPKSLTLAGVDAAEVVEEDKEALEKEKLKVKSVAGKDRISDVEVRFYSGKQLKILAWDSICVVLDVPCSGKDKSQTEKVRFALLRKTSRPNWLNTSMKTWPSAIETPNSYCPNPPQSPW